MRELCRRAHDRSPNRQPRVRHGGAAHEAMRQSCTCIGRTPRQTKVERAAASSSCTTAASGRGDEERIRPASGARTRCSGATRLAVAAAGSGAAARSTVCTPRKRPPHVSDRRPERSIVGAAPSAELSGVPACVDACAQPLSASTVTRHQAPRGGRASRAARCWSYLGRARVWALSQAARQPCTVAGRLEDDRKRRSGGGHRELEKFFLNRRSSRSPGQELPFW